MRIVIVGADDTSNVAGKLCDAELHFDSGPLAGMRLIGFSLWAPRSANASRLVTFPARTYSVNGERRSFALLRPITDAEAQDRIRDLILEAFAAFEAARALGQTDGEVFGFSVPVGALAQ